MRWPWQRPAVEHRSSYTDQVVTAILAAASGGGTRPALATAALESCATLYGSALSACEVAGPASVTRALTADWRASVASELIRRGQCVYIVDADPVDGSRSRPRRASTCTAARIAVDLPRRARGAVECALAHVRRRLNLAPSVAGRPLAAVGGCLSLQHAADTGSLAGWLENGWPKKRPGRSASFLPVARYEPAPDADLADPDADDPLAALRRDIGGAKGQVLAVESQMSAADSPASAPRKRFPGRALRRESSTRADRAERERRARHRRGVRSPARVTRRARIGASGARSVAAVCLDVGDGLARRIEAQLVEQLGVVVTFDSAPLGGRDLLARAAAFARLAKGGVPIDGARRAAGI